MVGQEKERLSETKLTRSGIAVNIVAGLKTASIFLYGALILALSVSLYVGCPDHGNSQYTLLYITDLSMTKFQLGPMSIQVHDNNNSSTVQFPGETSCSIVWMYNNHMS